MPDLAPFHQWIVFAHIIGVFLFLLAHGVSAGVMLRLRATRDPAAIRTLLEFSRWGLNAALVGFLIWVISGILAGFSGNYWTTGRYWIWASLGIALLVILLMTPMARFYLDRVRTAVGVDKKTGAVNHEAVVDSAALDAAMSSGRPILVAALGIGGVVVLTWLMMFKPF